MRTLIPAFIADQIANNVYGGEFEAAAAIREDFGQLNLAVESVAGRAWASMKRGVAEEAVDDVEEILTYLKDNTLDGTEEPSRIYLICYHILSVVGDAREGAILKTAQESLMERAGNIQDESMRRTVVDNIDIHREIRMEFEQKRSIDQQHDM